MKKMLPVIIVIIIALAGFGIYQMMQMKKPSTQSAEEAQYAQPQEQKQTETGGVFDSIKDAIAKSITVQCDFTDDTGRKTLAYIKAATIRVDATATTQGVSSSMIMKDNKMYSWDPTKKEGVVIDMMSASNMTPQGKEMLDKNMGGNATDVMKNLEKFKEHCKPGTVADSVFVPPTDVKFTDLSQMMQISGIPSIDPKQYEQYMQQYQQ